MCVAMLPPQRASSHRGRPTVLRAGTPRSAQSSARLAHRPAFRTPTSTFPSPWTEVDICRAGAMGLFRYSVVAVLTGVGIQVLPHFLATPKPLHLGGTVAPGWERVKEAFQQNHVDGWEKEGSAFAVFHKGKLVVDLWGGWGDKDAGRPWHEDTMTVVFSSTKAVSALAAQMLVDRGLLDYDAKVVKYWPEFSNHGKDKLTVAQFLSHRAGLAVIDADKQITIEMARANGDWKGLSKILEDQVPNWELGKDDHGYHAITYGWLVDALVRRVDPKKRSLGTFVRDEVVAPNGLDFAIGTERTAFHRVARGVPPDFKDLVTKFIHSGLGAVYMQYVTLRDTLLGKKSLITEIGDNPSWFMKDGVRFNDPEVLEAEVGAANGVGTARGLAGIFNAYNQGKLVKKGGVAWKRVRMPVRPLKNNLVIPMPLEWNCGYWAANNSLGDAELGHPGYGGQNVKFVPERELAYAYITNGLTPDMGDGAHNFAALQKAVLAIVKDLH